MGQIATQVRALPGGGGGGLADLSQLTSHRTKIIPDTGMRVTSSQLIAGSYAFAMMGTNILYVYIPSSHYCKLK